MKFEQRGKANGHIDTKRMYIPGVSLVSQCPECGELVEEDLGREYLSYPNVGKPERFTFFHNPADEDEDAHEHVEWSVNMVMDITFRLATEEELK